MKQRRQSSFAPSRCCKRCFPILQKLRLAVHSFCLKGTQTTSWSTEVQQLSNFYKSKPTIIVMKLRNLLAQGYRNEVALSQKAAFLIHSSRASVASLPSDPNPNTFLILSLAFLCLETKNPWYLPPYVQSLMKKLACICRRRGCRHLPAPRYRTLTTAQDMDLTSGNESWQRPAMRSPSKLEKSWQKAMNFLRSQQPRYTQEVHICSSAAYCILLEFYLHAQAKF